VRASRSLAGPLAIRSRPQSQPQLLQSQTQSLWPKPSTQTRPSSSSTRWKSRQTTDPYTKSSKLTALKSRAAYKLLEINDKHKLFRAGQSVVDLGYAPGSWSQVAKNRVGESGRVVGIDVIPAQPPRGVSALQGDFLSEGVQGLVREFVREWKSEELEEAGRGEEESGEVRSVVERAKGNAAAAAVTVGGEYEEGTQISGKTVEEEGEVTETETETETETPTLPLTPVAVEKEKKPSKKAKKLSPAALDLQRGRVVDVVLSDMCAPFPGLELSSWVNSVNRPYRRMMNTSGNPFRDHAGSIVRISWSAASQTKESDNLVLTRCF
jgi:21S rRNA (uridine2791-2'-O)-methyltransferase